MTRILIIGGGAIGLSAAFHLAKRGADDVTLLERNQLTSGTSWHAAGIVGPLRATPNMTRLAMAALEVFPELETETGMSTGYKRTGGYWLARETARMDELHRIADLGATQGLTPRVISASDIPLPMLNLSGHQGALFVPEDANVNPVDLCMAYAKAARTRGVTIKENTAVARLLTDETKVAGVELADGTMVQADKVVLATGAWSRALASTAGVALPLQAVEHMYVVTEPMLGLPDPFPVIRDLDRGIYIKGDAGKLVIGGFEPNAKCWDPQGPEGDRPFLEMTEDWDQFAPFMEAALQLCPSLEHVGIQHFMNGPESFTADTRPLVGETSVDGLFVAAGMNSVGVMSSAGIGSALADWMIDDNPPMNMWEVDVARVDPATAAPAHMEARMEEAVSDLFAMHWPYKQPKAGRGLRKSALHDQWAEAGAHFGVTAGWERGLWYGAAQPYSVGHQGWWEIAAREAAQLDQGAVLLDLSPFTCFHVYGTEALAFLNQTATAQLDREVGRVTYTPLLNAHGGIEMEATIARLHDDRFRITSGAATRWRDASYLRRAAMGFDVNFTDVTGHQAVIGVMGAGARELLSHTIFNDWHDFPFSTFRDIPYARESLRATRLSFVGELGWEISAAPDVARVLFQSLRAAGAQPMGHFALDGCRIEKGFVHWGHDIGPDVTPLEAGLGFTIDWNKDFLGRAALLAQRDHLSRRLMLFEVEGEPLLLHDEPIYESGMHVGFTTSGARGPRTGKDLCFGLIETAPGETRDVTCGRRFQIQVAGRFYDAKVLARPPFDPKGLRMRA